MLRFLPPGLILAAALCVAQSTSAQTAAPAPASVAELFALPEIAVTGRRREETLRDIPGGATVVPGANLTEGAGAPANDLARRVPNMSFTDLGSGIQNHLILRGVGAFSAPFNPADGSVTWNMLGAPFSATAFGTNLFDLQRVEVLRGPQGTLFGRSTLGGSVNLVPRPADGVREFSLSQEFGERGWAQTAAVAAGTLIPGALVGRAAFLFNTYPGDIPDDLRGGRGNGQDLAAGRATLRWTPDALTEANLIFFHEDQSGDPPRFVLRGTPPRTALDFPQHDDRRMTGGILTLSRDIGGGVRLASTTTIQQYRTRLINDDTDALLYSAAFGFPSAFFQDASADRTELRQRETVFGQEIRLSSPEGERLFWVVGANYFSSQSSLDREQSNRLFPSLNGRWNTDIEAYDAGTFGDMTYRLTEQLRLSVGLRFAAARQNYSNAFIGNGAPTVVPFFAESARVTDSGVTGRVALSWAPTAEVTLFAGLSRGRSPTGFQRFAENATLGLASQPYPTATSWSYEVGTRLTTPDRRASLDLTAFYTDVRNGPIAAFDPGSFTFSIETLDYSNYGLEAEARLRLPFGFALSGGIGVQHARLAQPPPGSNAGAQKDGRVPNVPDYNAFGALTWSQPVEIGPVAGSLAGRAEIQLVGDRAADISNSFDLAAYTLVNLRFGIETERFDLYAFARNLGDVRPELAGANFGTAQSIVYGRGRIIGAGTTIRF